MRNNFTLTLAIIWLVSVSAPLAAQRLAPDFRLPLLIGDGSVSLADYRGSFVLVDFWASWCPPCRESLPAYDALRQELHDRFGKETFEVLAINVDITDREGRAFAQGLSPGYPLLRENTGATQRAFNLAAMPSAFLINPDGEVLFEFSGFSEHHLKVLRQHLIRLLGTSAADSKNSSHLNREN